MTNNCLFEQDINYINEAHIQAFAKALSRDDVIDNETVDNTGHEATNRDPNNLKPTKIASKSDWLPVHSHTVDNTTKSGNAKGKAKAEPVRDEFRDSVAYAILRWPILFFVGVWISILCVLYSIVRFYVALLEYYITWRGERRKLRDKLRNSKTYQEWIDHALELDKHLNLDKWSIDPKFSYYDSRTIEMTIQKLNQLKADGLDHELLVVLQGCLKHNFAGIENRQLYSHRYYGTKDLVQTYIDLIIECIDHIVASETVDVVTKRRFFRIALKNYGKTALCLSGGACFSYTHFGVIKALLDNDLLPSIISGTSGGGLIAALTCTRTNSELKQLLVPQLARKITACEDPFLVWFPRFWKTGARFDSVAWAEKAQFFTRGSMTFQDAYKRTGRKLNISTVPADRHSPVILCNNITSPNCIIWSSLLASSAVPGILNPVVLMMRNSGDGDDIVPFSLGSKWRDGSLRTDIPIDALNTYYNVNFSIVSQVNPHILLFFYAPKGTVGRPVSISRRYTHKNQFASFRGGFLSAAIEQLLRLEITKWLKIIKTLDLLPHVFEQDWSNIWLQRFSGTITVWPRNRLADFLYILSDPTEERLEGMLMKGQRSMFPRMLFIKNRLSIERAIEAGKKLTKQMAAKVGDNFLDQNHRNDNDANYDDNDDDDSSSDEEYTKVYVSPFDTYTNEETQSPEALDSPDI